MRWFVIRENEVTTVSLVVTLVNAPMFTFALVRLALSFSHLARLSG